MEKKKQAQATLEIIGEKTEKTVVGLSARARWLHHTLASTPSLLILLSLLWGLIITTLVLGWGHLETKALIMLSQDMRLEFGLTHQREDQEQLDLLLDQQISNIDIELESKR